MYVACMLHGCCMYVARALRRSASPPALPFAQTSPGPFPARSRTLFRIPTMFPRSLLRPPLPCYHSPANPQPFPTHPQPSLPCNPNRSPAPVPSDHSCPLAIPADRPRSHLWPLPPIASSRPPHRPMSHSCPDCAAHPAPPVRTARALRKSNCSSVS